MWLCDCARIAKCAIPDRPEHNGIHHVSVSLPEFLETRFRVKLGYILYVFLAFGLFELLYFGAGGAAASFTIPTLEIPDFEFVDLSTGCGGFVDCIEYVGAVIYNIGLGIIFLVLFLIRLFVYVIEIVVLITDLMFTGFEGAPAIINVLITTPFYMSVALIVYRLLRKGDSTDET